jgi:4-hydroxybenzoate polyprenyltransferase
MTAIESAGPAAAAGRAARVRAVAMDLVSLIRPLHSAKSLLLVPVALVDPSAWTVGALAGLGWAMAAFVLASACVYVGNDIADRDRDRQHPVKRQRPIAAGRVPLAAGYLYCAGLLALLAVVVSTAPGRPYWPVLAYLALNLAYSAALKHVPLVDAGVVALGFVLRVVQVYLATGTRICDWLLVTVFSLSLLLTIGKRRQELLEVGVAHRPALAGYSVELATQLLHLTCVLSVVAGLIYLRTEAPFGSYDRAAMLLSTPLAIFALSRYLQVLLVHGGGGDPVRMLLRDRAMVCTGALWGAALGAMVALAHYPTLASVVLTLGSTFGRRG